MTAQDEWGKRFPLYSLIPYNTDGRRVFGYLRALEDGCDLMVSIDDDNFPTAGRLFGGHLRTGQAWRRPSFREEKLFHNICEYLTFSRSDWCFPGISIPTARAGESAESIPAPKNTVIGVTEGLWFDEPDVDATTWLNGKNQGNEI